MTTYQALRDIWHQNPLNPTAAPRQRATDTPNRRPQRSDFRVSVCAKTYQHARALGYRTSSASSYRWTIYEVSTGRMLATGSTMTFRGAHRKAERKIKKRFLAL